MKVAPWLAAADSGLRRLSRGRQSYANPFFRDELQETKKVQLLSRPVKIGKEIYEFSVWTKKFQVENMGKGKCYYSLSLEKPLLSPRCAVLCASLYSSRLFMTIDDDDNHEFTIYK